MDKLAALYVLIKDAGTKAEKKRSRKDMVKAANACATLDLTAAATNEVLRWLEYVDETYQPYSAYLPKTRIM